MSSPAHRSATEPPARQLRRDRRSGHQPNRQPSNHLRSRCSPLPHRATTASTLKSPNSINGAMKGSGIRCPCSMHPLSPACVMATTAWVGSAHRPPTNTPVADGTQHHKQDARVRDVRKLHRNRQNRVARSPLLSPSAGPPAVAENSAPHRPSGRTWATIRRHCAQEPGAQTHPSIRRFPVYTLYTPTRCFPTTISAIWWLSAFQRHLWLVEQFQVGFRGPGRGCQVVADDRGVDAPDASAAPRSQGDLSATGRLRHGAR